MDDGQDVDKDTQRQPDELDRQRSQHLVSDPGKSKAEQALQVQWIQERIEPFQDKIQTLIETWNSLVQKLLTEISVSSWGEQKSDRYSWTLQSSIIWSEESQTPSLYWVALRRQPYAYTWFAVELRTDLEASPIRYVIYCKESAYTISADLTADALKSALVTAFRLGPLVNIFYEPVPGVLIE
jgi:hypothetical protein